MDAALLATSPPPPARLTRPPHTRAHTCARAGLKGLLLEKRVEALSGALEMREAQLGEVLVTAQLDPSTLQQVGGG